jgi:hypothetical protein
MVWTGTFTRLLARMLRSCDPCTEHQLFGERILDEGIQ